MSEQLLDKFISENISCATCLYNQPMIYGFFCKSPDGALGEMTDDTSMCEAHEFHDIHLEKQLSELTAQYLSSIGF